MLAADDAGLAARDRRLPGLRLVLDGDAVTEALGAAHPQLRVTRATPAYVRYKPGTSCLVAYRLRLADGTERDAVARTYPDASHAKLAKVLATAPRPTDGTGLAALLDPRTVCTLEPHDPDLPALVRLAHPGMRAALVARALDVDVDAVDGWTLTRLRYKPERRWVGRVAVHRDLHDGPLLVDGTQVGLLDPDTLALGEPELDLGNLLAHLQLAVCAGRCDDAVRRSGRSAVSDASWTSTVRSSRPSRSSASR